MSRARSVADLGNQNVLDLNANDGTLKVGAGVTIENTGEAQFVGIVTADQFAGDIVGATGTFSGNVSVGGTLTYEDVTSIDSVGIITARSGINVTGTVTADNFSGTDGSFIILNGGANNAFHVDGGAPASSLHVENGGEISVNTTLKVGTAIGIGTDNPTAALHVLSTAYPTATVTRNHAVNYPRLRIVNAVNDGADLDGIGDGTGGFRISCVAAGVSTERLRITSAGALNIGKGDESANSANLVEMYVGATDDAYGTIRGKYNRGNEYNRSEVRFGVESNASGTGFLAFATGNNSATEKLRITSAGNVTIGAKSYPNWHSSVDALTIGYAGCLYEDSYAVGGVAGRDNYAVLGNNTYYASSGGNTYINNDEASRIMMHGGDFYFQNASQGIAGNAITFNTRLKITSGGDLIQKEMYSTYTNNSSVLGSATRTLTITGLRYGTATIHFGGSDGNGQYVHFKINFGGMMWGAGNGYNAEVSSSCLLYTSPSPRD